MTAWRASRKLMKAIKAIEEESDDENDDDDDGEPEPTRADEDFLMRHMMDCLSLLAGLQKEGNQDIAVNSAKARMTFKVRT